MKPFNHTNATSLAEVKTALGGGKAIITAGGTDLLGTLKDNILPDYPSTVINLKTVPGLDFIKEEGGMLKIGAVTRLADIANNPTVKQRYTAAISPNCTAAGTSANRKTASTAYARAAINASP